MPGGRIVTQKPKARSRTQLSPGPHHGAAREGYWEPRRDADLEENELARPPREAISQFELSRIGVFSPQERRALDGSRSAFSAGRKVDPRTQSYLRMRFGDAPPVLAVQPVSASGFIPAQSRIEVGPVNDSLEKEADSVADRVMRTPAAAASTTGVQASTAKSAGAKAPPIVKDVLQSPGTPLDAGLRQFMEPRFRYDFRDVRVHADARAAESARAVGARAYTVGQHLVFGASAYAPGTAKGRRLIAHELGHVLQQSQGASVALQRQPAEDWNFTRSDYAKVTGGSSPKKLTVATDSSWFPARLQQNLLNTLDFVLGSSVSPPGTEGINAVDFFHGHLVIKKDPATDAQTATAKAAGDQVGADLRTKRTAALGRDVKFSQITPDYKVVSGYPFVSDSSKTAEQKVDAYKKVVEQVEPSLGKMMDDAIKIPGAAVVYHTFEFNQPSDLTAKGKKLDHNDPRRNYVTPLDSNKPAQYTTPIGAASYEAEYTVVSQFSFLVDKSGAVHVRPFDAGPTGFTSLELSTITGKPFAKSPGFDR